MEINHDIDALRVSLSKGETRLVFLKLDGSFREARGTTSLSLIPACDHPKGKRRPSDKVQVFYDLDIEEWRCLRRDKLLGFIEN